MVESDEEDKLDHDKEESDVSQEDNVDEDQWADADQEQQDQLSVSTLANQKQRVSAKKRRLLLIRRVGLAGKNKITVSKI